MTVIFVEIPWNGAQSGLALASKQCHNRRIQATGSDGNYERFGAMSVKLRMFRKNTFEVIVRVSLTTRIKETALQPQRIVHLACGGATKVRKTVKKCELVRGNETSSDTPKDNARPQSARLVAQALSESP